MRGRAGNGVVDAWAVHLRLHRLLVSLSQDRVRRAAVRGAVGSLVKPVSKLDRLRARVVKAEAVVKALVTKGERMSAVQEAEAIARMAVLNLEREELRTRELWKPGES